MVSTIRPVSDALYIHIHVSNIISSSRNTEKVHKVESRVPLSSLPLEKYIFTKWVMDDSDEKINKLESKIPNSKK